MFLRFCLGNYITDDFIAEVRTLKHDTNLYDIWKISTQKNDYVDFSATILYGFDDWNDQLDFLNPFLSNVLILSPMKTLERFSGVFRGYKIRLLARNGLNW